MTSHVRRMLLACVVGVLACAPGAAMQHDEAHDSPKLRIDWPEFKKLYDARKVDVIDVRDPDSYALGHIPGARLIPLDEIPRRAAELKKLRRPLVLYCA